MIGSSGHRKPAGNLVFDHPITRWPDRPILCNHKSLPKGRITRCLMMSKKMDTVLVVDDDTELCGLVQEYLASEGFMAKAVYDGEQGLEQALTGAHSLVVLDVMLPGMNGFEVLRRIRSVSKVPVLLLTARGEDVDRIVGLEIGADDYLPKPFNPRELVARIRAILRRTR